MGVYDTIVFKCPECDQPISAQTKSGDCTLTEYNFTSVPIPVAIDANRHAPFQCYNCGKFWHFGNIPTSTTLSISLTIKEGVE